MLTDIFGQSAFLDSQCCLQLPLTFVLCQVLEREPLILFRVEVKQTKWNHDEKPEDAVLNK